MLKGFHNFWYFDPYVNQEPHYFWLETIKSIHTVSLLLVFSLKLGGLCA